MKTILTDAAIARHFVLSFIGSGAHLVCKILRVSPMLSRRGENILLIEFVVWMCTYVSLV